LSEHNTYLSDEELEQLIAEVEANEIVSAPPNLMTDVLAKVETRTRTKSKEFQLYCFRVITSVAAAILLLFMLPGISELQLKLSEVMEESTTVEDLRAERVTPRYASKEEAVNDRGILSAAFGSNKLFGEDRDWNIFE